MKKILFFFALLPLLAQGQRLERMPAPSEVEKAYRPEYRAQLRAYERQAAQLRADGYDIILDDLQQVPTAISIASTAQRNWGETLLSDVRARVAAECTRPVIVKVADTGGKFTHNDLIFGQLPGKSYTGEATLEDKNGHGTHCAGIIAGKGIGLAWEMVEKMRLKIKPIKILGDGGGGSFTWVANAIASERAEDVAFIKSGTPVIYSGSFGGGTAIITPVEAEIQKSVAEGVFFVFAAGNTGGPVNYPGMSPHAITVASLDQSMAVSSYSSRGPEVDNAMPGRNINSTYKDGTYATLSGTSMATPFLSAAVAIALSKWGQGKLPNTAAMKAYLAKVATDIPPSGKDDPSGWGAVFIRAILDTEPAGGTPPPPPPPPPADPPSEKVIVSTTLRNVTMRYSFAGEAGPTLRNLNILEIELYASGETAEAALQAIQGEADKFFAQSYIAEIPKSGKGIESGLQGAAYWTGTFLNYAGRPIGLRVQRIVAKGEKASDLPFILENIFDRADVTPESYDGTGVKLRRY